MSFLYCWESDCIPSEIYRKDNYSILQVDDGFIVVNEDMDDFAHTHIINLKSAKWIIDISICKRHPYNIPRYFIQSLIRINDDEKYLEKLEAILKKKNHKKDYYYNSNKGRR